ncbi:COG1361 S-layer family protein [Thermococcus paralvinellae]|uniref:S-layer domain-containing protein n=1 Tax=Thermococcus paralvinellae TaxID=582419 RepID=W0I9R9_9EURY|nr:hypothetical protein [Thermococcus paralvinellae]AHF81173.1 Hypothetical protein TES1_1798 [Thermococcus paralvinellae]
MKKFGMLLGVMIIMASFNIALAQDALLFEGYLNKGDTILVGPIIITLNDVQKDYLTNQYKAMFVIMKDGKILNANYTVIYIPNPSKIQELLADPAFLNAMAETLGYNTTDPLSYAQFLAWLATASPEEIADAVFETINEHPELGINKEDLLMPIRVPEFTYISENETIELNVDGQKVTITALEIYPNGVRISISGPYDWKVSVIPALITTSIEAPKSVNPGQEFIVKVHLKNEGALKAKYITVMVSPVMLDVGSSENQDSQSSTGQALAQTLSQSGVVQSALMPVNTSMKYIEYLDGKESATLEFKFKANENAQPGVYPLYVTVIYFFGVGQDVQQMQSFNFVGITVARDSDASFVIESIEKPKIVHPGEDFEVKIRLRNMGGDTAKDFLATIEPKGSLNIEEQQIQNAQLSGNNLPMETKTPILVANETDQYYRAIVRPNDEVELTFRLHVSEDAETGSYPVTLKLTYYSGDSKESKSQSFEFSVQVLRKREAFIEIESIEMDPKKVEPGDEFTLTLKLRNVGEENARAFALKIIPTRVPVQGEIKKVDLSSLQNLPIQGSQSISENLQEALNQILKELAKRNVDAFLPIGEDNVKYVPEIAPNQEVTLTFHLKANNRLESGIYPLRIGIEYLSSPDDSKISDERLIGINVLGKEQLIISKVSTSPSRVYPGTHNVEISLSVENIGSGEAKYVLLIPKPQSPFELSDTSEQIINLGTLRQGDSANAVFRINVNEDAKGGSYKIPVEIQYKDSLGNSQKIMLNVPIIIHEKPKLVVENVRFDKTPMQGEEVRVYITVKNIGGEKAENVMIEGVVKSSQPFTLTKRTDYIGNLKPGQSGEGVIELSIDRDAVPKTYVVQIRMRAVGDKESGDDNVYVFEDSVKIPVQENTKQAHTLKYLGIGVGILVVLAVVITYLKRRE